MKAIQIFEVNRELIEDWGVSEELTWANAFGSLVGNVLVIDDNLPQGYAVKEPSVFLDEYLWWTNFGTHGWSEVKRVSDMDVGSDPEPERFIYIVWDMNLQGYYPTMKTIHKTLDGAIQAIPESIRNDNRMKQDLCPPYVANYTYLAIEERILEP